MTFSNSLRILIVHFGDVNKTGNCVKSIQNCIENPWKYQIVVIDNSGEKQLYKSEFDKIYDRVTIISVEANEGYAAALNHGIRFSENDDTAFFLLLNNDLILEPEALAKLYHAVVESPAAGLWGGTLVLSDNPEIIWFGGGEIQPALCRTKHKFFKKNRATITNFKKSNDFITGAMMLVEREVFTEIGLFSTDYFLYFEDVDFCSRAQRSGFYPIVTPDVLAKHDVGAMQNRSYTPEYLYYQTRNRAYFFSSYSGFFYRIYFQIVNLLVFVLFRTIFIFFTNSKTTRMECCKAVLSGYWHSLKKVKWTGRTRQ
ncbi:MAG: glycosyltransferase family 2 protein [Calditrichaeota bacterium]|nr:MAG: glycosyltransferase family 2 protein [Calditrichota bacterium]